MRQQEQVRTIPAVNAHAASAGDIANDLISGHGLTTLRVPHEQAIRALNPDALTRPSHAIDNAFEGALLLGRFGRLEIRVQRLQQLQDVHVASADRCDEVRRILELQQLRDRL